MEKFGADTQRPQRNTDLSHLIFVPHRSGEEKWLTHQLTGAAMQGAARDRRAVCALLAGAGLAAGAGAGAAAAQHRQECSQQPARGGHTVD